MNHSLNKIAGFVEGLSRNRFGSILGDWGEPGSPDPTRPDPTRPDPTRPVRFETS